MNLEHRYLLDNMVSDYARERIADGERSVEREEAAVSEYRARRAVQVISLRKPHVNPYPMPSPMISVAEAGYMVKQLNETGSAFFIGNKLVAPGEWYIRGCAAHGRTRCVACYALGRGDDYAGDLIRDRLEQLQNQLHVKGNQS